MHTSFQLQGQEFDSHEELLDYALLVSEELYQFLEEWYNDRAYISVQTSGSTGTPKTIQLDKKLMRNSAKATGAYFELPAETKALCCLSTNYIAGKMMVVRALELGWHLDVVAPTSNPLEDLFDTYDFCAMVPMQVKASLWDLHLVKKMIIGGGVVSEGLLAQLQKVQTACYATYGMTETITHVAVKPLNGEQASEVYTVLPNVVVSKDARNCLVIDAPNVARETVVTNDVVALQSDQSFEWLGRYDNVINSGGVKLHPEQLEKKLSPIFQQRYFVIGQPDEVLGEKLVLVVEGTEQEIDFYKLNLSKFEKPKEVYFVPKFIETATNKIQRNKTLELILSL